MLNRVLAVLHHVWHSCQHIRGQVRYRNLSCAFASENPFYCYMMSRHSHM